jgi:hypothetical protein
VNGDFSQTASVTLILLVLTHTQLCRTWLLHGVALIGSYPLTTQKGHEMIQRGAVSQVRSSMPVAMPEVSCQILRRHSVYWRSCLQKPAVEACSQQNVPVNVVLSVSLLDK